MKIDAIATGPELICADCGVRFQARRVTDGVEEICGACYEARFPTFSAPQLQRISPTFHGHLAAD
ncbi:MAG: hypothetical protein WA876_07600 [Candidatus Acidiferrales bacterium]